MNEPKVIEYFESLTSTAQNEVLKKLIDTAVKIDTAKILKAIVDKVGCIEASEKLTSIITDYIY